MTDSSARSFVDLSEEFSRLATDEQLSATAAALESNGIVCIIAKDGEEARRLVADQLFEGTEVFNNTSRTLESIGVAEDIEQSGRYQPVRLRLYQMDREMQEHEMRVLAASPDYVVGSAHAVTLDGSLLIASASGSQLGPVVSGARQVVLVIGSQKIVADTNTAFGISTNTAFHSKTIERVALMGCPAV